MTTDTHSTTRKNTLLLPLNSLLPIFLSHDLEKYGYYWSRLCRRGGNGIGKACRLAFAKIGARGVLVADIDVKAAKKTADEAKGAAANLDFQAETVDIDVANEDSARSAVEKMVALFGRIDYCVHSAGQNDASSANRGFTRGTIVTLASVTSKLALPATVRYTAAKHAILAISKAAAITNGPYGIRVNCICPSSIDNPMAQQSFDLVPGLKETGLDGQPMGRLGTLEEVTDAALFLCGPKSSSITGCGLITDGGMSLLSFDFFRTTLILIVELFKRRHLI
ncbi:hypothetical protein Hte_007646 [Hypoxylon texense]